MGARNPSMIPRYARLQRRVNALETGAHPMGRGIEIYETIPKTIMTDESGAVLAPLTSGNLTWAPWYSKRSGNVLLGGAVTGYMNDLPIQGEKYSTLPPGLRPAMDLEIVRMALTNDGMFAVVGRPVVVRIATSGEIRFFNSFGISDEDEGGISTLHLDGIAFPTA